MTHGKEFALPPQLGITAAQDQISKSEAVLRIFRDAQRLGNPLAHKDALYFVLSFDIWDNTFTMAGSFVDAKIAMAFARAQVKEAGDDELISYYPFDKSGNLLDPTE